MTATPDPAKAPSTMAAVAAWLRRPRYAAAVAGLILVALPLVLPARAIGTLIQMLVAALFALAFNILWQQTRLLSFGHAAFFGIGMFATIHAMRAAASGAFALPLPLLPLAGLLSALILGAVVGYFATARTGTYFAMITLAFAELIHQLAPQWEAVFGGESGLSTMRMPWAGLSFGSSRQTYYLVLVWFLIGVMGIHYFTRTPLGRLAFALGDNELRVRFLGYNARLGKTLVFAVSATFAGLAGGLLAVANENADHSVFAAAVSGLVVIHTFVGGANLFLGPVFGAAALVLFGSVVSDITRLWILYQGMLFIFVVMFVPQGLVGLAVDLVGAGRWRELRRTAAPVLLTLAAAMLAAAGFVFVAEFFSALTADPFALQTRGGAVSVRLWGISWQANSVSTWAFPVVAIGAAALMLLANRSQAAADSAEGEPVAPKAVP
jgi:branched-chain amino acid transport system permease protein